MSAGRQLTVLGFEKDESPNMYQTSYAYLTDLSADLPNDSGTKALKSFIGMPTDFYCYFRFNLTKNALSAATIASHPNTFPYLNDTDASGDLINPVANPTDFALPNFVVEIMSMVFV